MSFRPRNQRCDGSFFTVTGHPATPFRFSPLPCLISLRHVSSNHLHFFPICPLPNVAFRYINSKPLLLAGSAPEAERCGLHLFCFVRPHKITTMPPTPFIFLFFFLGLRRLGLNVQIMKSYEVTNFLSVKSKFCSYLDQGGK